jgi:predicted RNA binding protein YcfA (HicA-like mRNA interferase family)
MVETAMRRNRVPRPSALHTRVELRLCAIAQVCNRTHMKSADIIKALRSDGWTEVARRGSHAQFKHPTKPGRVTVPHPKKDIPVGTLRSIERQAGIKLD